MKKLCFVIALSLIFALCGCTGYREINRGYLVTAIGFLKEDGQASILIEAISSSDVLDEKSERVVLTDSGENVKAAYNNLKASLVKPLYFEQLGTVVFENGETDDVEFLNEIPNLNFGIYVVQTDDVKALFEHNTSNGAIGYDIIGLIKNHNKENDNKILTQFYKVKQNPRLPTVNFTGGRLVIVNEDE